MNDAELKRHILSMIKKPGLASLATITEDGKPWARYVIAVGFDDMSIRLATVLTTRKVKQIVKNPNVHLAFGASSADYQADYLQIQGKARVTTDLAEKKAFWHDELKQFFTGPDDPSYGIIVIDPERIELWFGELEPKVWEATEK